MQEGDDILDRVAVADGVGGGVMVGGLSSITQITPWM